MITLRKPLPRRTVLRGGGFALALPFLEAMAPRRARASTAPRRFITYFVENGMYPPSWEPPSGGETDFTLSPVLKQLESFRSHLLVLKGVDLMGSSGTCNHRGGSVGFLTARPNFVAPAKSGSGLGPSLDQYIAGKIGRATRFASLQLAGPDSNYHITYAGANQPIPPESNPYTLFARLFGEGNGGADALAKLQRKRKSILDFVAGRLQRMQMALGGEDARRLEWHATSVREIELQLAKLGQVGAGCVVPELGPTRIAVNQKRSYGFFPAFVEQSKVMMDLLFSALACDLTRVATFEAGGTDSYFHWLGHPTSGLAHHGLSHEPDSNADATRKLTEIGVWFASQVAYLAGKMKAFREGDGTMLDNALILWGNQLGRGNSHSLSDAPFFLLGKAGGALRTGRYLRYQGRVPHNNLLVSILNAMGLPDTTFGQPDWCTGPLRELAA